MVIMSFPYCQLSVYMFCLQLVTVLDRSLTFSVINCICESMIVWMKKSICQCASYQEENLSLPCISNFETSVRCRHLNQGSQVFKAIAKKKGPSQLNVPKVWHWKGLCLFASLIENKTVTHTLSYLLTQIQLPYVFGILKNAYSLL